MQGRAVIIDQNHAVFWNDLWLTSTNVIYVTMGLTDAHFASLIPRSCFV